jgi:hypothetical protein
MAGFKNQFTHVALDMNQLINEAVSHNLRVAVVSDK